MGDTVSDQTNTTDDQHDWASNFTGINTRGANGDAGNAPSNGSGDTQAAPSGQDANAGSATSSGSDLNAGQTNANGQDPSAPAPASPNQAGDQSDAPKKINVTLVTSYGQEVRYWVQDRATDHDNEAPEGSGTVLIDGDTHGPGDKIALTCIETANGASICYTRESNPFPPGSQKIGWSSVTIPDGGSFTIQETGQTMAAPTGAAAPANDAPGANANGQDPNSGQANTSGQDPNSGQANAGGQDPNSGQANTSGQDPNSGQTNANGQDPNSGQANANGQDPNSGQANANGQDPNSGQANANGQDPNSGQANANGQDPNSGQASANGQDPNSGQTNANGQDPNSGQANANGQDPNSGQTNANGQDPNSGQANANGQDPNSGQASANGQDPNSGQTNANGQDPNASGANDSPPTALYYSISGAEVAQLKSTTSSGAVQDALKSEFTIKAAGQAWGIDPTDKAAVQKWMANANQAAVQDPAKVDQISRARNDQTRIVGLTNNISDLTIQSKAAAEHIENLKDLQEALDKAQKAAKNNDDPTAGKAMEWVYDLANCAVQAALDWDPKDVAKSVAKVISDMAGADALKDNVQKLADKLRKLTDAMTHAITGLAAFSSKEAETYAKQLTDLLASINARQKDLLAATDKFHDEVEAVFKGKDSDGIAQQLISAVRKEIESSLKALGDASKAGPLSDTKFHSAMVPLGDFSFESDNGVFYKQGGRTNAFHKDGGIVRGDVEQVAGVLNELDATLQRVSALEQLWGEAAAKAFGW
jgi:hypothetical protein